jgi:hypothetical protein
MEYRTAIFSISLWKWLPTMFANMKNRFASLKNGGTLQLAFFSG